MIKQILFLMLLSSVVIRLDAATARAYIFEATNLADSAAPRPPILGIIEFKDDGGAVKVSGEISGLTSGLHGFHVHQKGDVGDSCKSAGGHFNPQKNSHGAPSLRRRSGQYQCRGKQCEHLHQRQPHQTEGQAFHHWSSSRHSREGRRFGIGRNGGQQNHRRCWRSSGLRCHCYCR